MDGTVQKCIILDNNNGKKMYQKTLAKFSNAAIIWNRVAAISFNCY